MFAISTVLFMEDICLDFKEDDSMKKNFWKTVGFIKGIGVSAQIGFTILVGIAGAVGGICWAWKCCVEPLKKKLNKKKEEVDEAA